MSCDANNSAEWRLEVPVCSTRYHSLAILVVVALVLSLITLWTILGNLMVLMALYKYGNLRTMSNCLIGNLAISDLLLALTVLPISTGNDLLGYWVFGKLACTIWLCIDVLYCTASIWGLCTVAFDRYMATVYPVWYHDQRSVKKAVACIVFVWIFSIIISLAPFIGWRHMIPNCFTFNADIDRYECVLYTSSSYVIYSSMGSFIIPSCLMTFMYIRIFVVLHKQSKGLNSKRQARDNVPKQAPNGSLVGHAPLDEVRRDYTTTTLMDENGGSTQYLGENSSNSTALTDVDKILNLPYPHNLTHADACGVVIHTDDSQEIKLCVPLNDLQKRHSQDGIVSSPSPLAASYNKRSNSFASPSDGLKENTSRTSDFLNVADLDRRNSHNIAIQRSASETGTINSGGMASLTLIPLCQRSKSANLLTTYDNDKEAFRNVKSSPRRSLPCNISKLERSKRLTVSMKRRFELREQRATKRMLLIMASFCVCWMPFLFMYITRSVCETCHMNRHLVAAIIWLGYLNSSLNPILYTLFNDDFRDAFKTLVGMGSKVAASRNRRKAR